MTNAFKSDNRIYNRVKLECEVETDELSTLEYDKVGQDANPVQLSEDSLFARKHEETFSIISQEDISNATENVVANDGDDDNSDAINVAVTEINHNLTQNFSEIVSTASLSATQTETHSTADVTYTKQTTILTTESTEKSEENLASQVSTDQNVASNEQSETKDAEYDEDSKIVELKMPAVLSDDCTTINASGIYS